MSFEFQTNTYSCTSHNTHAHSLTITLRMPNGQRRGDAAAIAKLSEAQRRIDCPLVVCVFLFCFLFLQSTREYVECNDRSTSSGTHSNSKHLLLFAVSRINLIRKYLFGCVENITVDAASLLPQPPPMLPGNTATQQRSHAARHRSFRFVSFVSRVGFDLS